MVLIPIIALVGLFVRHLIMLIRDGEWGSAVVIALFGMFLAGMIMINLS